MTSDTLRRGRPIHALGGTPRKDHLFDEDNRSLCGSWMYGGGYEVERPDVSVDDDELCIGCARKV